MSRSILSHGKLDFWLRLFRLFHHSHCTSRKKDQIEGLFMGTL